MKISYYLRIYLAISWNYFDNINLSQSGRLKLFVWVDVHNFSWFNNKISLRRSKNPITSHDLYILLFIAYYATPAKNTYRFL